MTRVDSAATYWERCKDEILEGCDLCGACLEACHRYRYPESGLKDPLEDIKRYHDFWRTGTVDDDLHGLIYTCTGCALCRDVCPIGFNVYDAYNYHSKLLARQSGHPPKFTMEPRMPHVRGNIAAVLSAMQMRPEQVRWHWNLDSNTPKKEVLLFIGCITHSHPDKIFTLLDVFDRMGVDYLALGGGPICCGGSFIVAGQADEATACAKHMAAKFNAYGASEVVFWCANCVRHCMGFIPQIADLRFEPVHASTFMARNLDRLNFTHNVDLTVNVHDSCVLGRAGVREYGSVRSLLEAIPGLSLVDHAESGEKAPCCAAGKGAMNLAMRRRLYDLVAGTGADLMATACNTCTMTMGPEDTELPFEITNFITVVGRALGVNHEERLKRFLQLGDLKRVMAESRECFALHGYSEHEVQEKVGPLFS